MISPMSYMKLIKLQFFKGFLYIFFLYFKLSYVKRLLSIITHSSTGIFLKFTSIISFLERRVLWKINAQDHCSWENLHSCFTFTFVHRFKESARIMTNSLLFLSNYSQRNLFVLKIFAKLFLSDLVS